VCAPASGWERLPSEERLAGIPWRGLAGLGGALAEPLAAVLAGAAAERVVDRFLRAHRDLSADARRAAKEAIYGVAVWRRRLAYQSDATATAPPPLLLAALLRDLAGLPTPDAEDLAAAPRGALPPPRPPPRDLATRLSFPDWLAATLEREAGPDAFALADALNLPGPVCLRPNALRTSPDALADRLAREGVATRPGALVPSSLVVTSPTVNILALPSFRDGLFEVQDEASQLAGALVGARPGDAVLDLCAGAGGKSLQLAAAVGRDGAVHATDVDAEKLERLAPRADRAGAGAIVRVHGAAPPDGLRVPCALVDAPCSELGALRRGPDQRFRLDPAAFDALPPLQLGLVARAARHVAPGGTLVYATCTFRREEDEDVARAFEASHPAFERNPAPPATRTPDGFSRTWPHRHGADAFFAAAWRRRG
jgi:16S rRNA (cytosine967-C5)-methyltransferase